MIKTVYFLFCTLLLTGAACTQEREQPPRGDTSPNAEKQEAEVTADGEPIPKEDGEGDVEDDPVSDEAGPPGLVRLDGRVESSDEGLTPGALAPAELGSTKLARADVPAKDFEELDKNGNGYISPEEAESAPGLDAVFGDLDADRDGKLEPEEFARFEELEVEEAPADNINRREQEER